MVGARRKLFQKEKCTAELSIEHVHWRPMVSASELLLLLLFVRNEDNAARKRERELGEVQSTPRAILMFVLDAIRQILS